MPPEPTNEELFAKFDPEQLSPELQKVYKDMQADYTRKTQALAEQRKGYEVRETQWKTDLQDIGALRKENQQWQQWWTQLEQESKANDGDPASKDGAQPTGVDYLQDSPEVAKAVEALISPLTKKLTAQEQQLSSMTEALKNSQDQLMRMFDYQSQLSDLALAHPELDRSKLLEHAQKTGQTDLNKVYEDLYREDIITKAVDERVAEREKELRTRSISTPGKQVIYKPNQKLPKSFEEATQSILNERAVEGKLE